MKIFIVVFLSFFLFSICSSQNCFIQIADQTGLIVPQQKINNLENAACALKNTLPNEFQSQFKVYDFGFYLLGESTTDGLEVSWNNAKNNVIGQSDYYLILGKQLSNTQNESKIWVELSLPSTGSLACLTNDKTEGLKQELTTILNEATEANEWIEYELEAINRVKEFMNRVLTCCPSLAGKMTGNGIIDSSLLTITLCLDNSCEKDPPNSVALISRTPTMPQIAFKLDYADTLCTFLNAELRITYKRTTKVVSRNRQDSIQVFIENLGLGFNYVFDLKDEFQGGRAAIIISDPFDNEIKRFLFTVKALNPTAKMVYDYIDEEKYSEDFWFLKQMATHENGAKPKNLNSRLYQFNEHNPTGENLQESWEAYSRCPNLSSNKDGGWGLTQLTLPVPKKETLWNWKKNIESAFKLLEQKAKVAEGRLNVWLPKIDEWNERNATDTVEYHSNYVDGGITWVHKMNDYFENDNDVEDHFPDGLADGERSFLDAMIIKMFNGIGTIRAPHYDKHYYYLSYNSSDPAIKPEWKVDNSAHYGTSVNYYVRSIANTKIPTK